MLAITWLEGEAQGCVDYLPDWAVSESVRGILVHTGSKPSGGGYLAKCNVWSDQHSTFYDYSEFGAFNQRQEVFQGVMEILFDGGLPKRVRWKDKGGPDFEPLRTKLSYQPGVLAEPPVKPKLGSTQTMQQRAARTGQGRFRLDLQLRFSGRCALTGISNDALLRASHIQPWADSTDDERLDPDNGLLLAAHVDALFDQHLISFDDDGALIWSEHVSPSDRTALQLPNTLVSGPLIGPQRLYMRAHRALLRTA